MTTTIRVINQSTVLTNDQIGAALPAFQKAYNEHLAPAWKLEPCMLLPDKTEGSAGPGIWEIYVLDTSDQAGALGYHTDDGLPRSKVFAKETIRAGLSWEVTFTHELFEMGVDPTTSRTRRNYAVEVGDPVEGDEWAYTVDGVQISDFALPAWWGALKAPGPYDYQGHCTKPHQLLKDGYCLLYSKKLGWHQKFASLHRLTRPGTSGRGARRMAAAE